MRVFNAILILCSITACGDTGNIGPSGDQTTPDAGQPDAACVGECEDATVEPDGSDAGFDSDSDSGAIGLPLSITVDVSPVQNTPAGDLLSGVIVITAEIGGGVDRSVMGVEFLLDGFRFDTALIPPYSTHIDSSTFDDGEYELAVFTANASGQTASDSVTVRIDNEPPVFAERAPVEGAAVFFEFGGTAGCCSA